MKFVVFKTPYEYCDFMCGSLLNRSDVAIIEPISFNKFSIDGLIFHLLLRICPALFYKRLVRKFVTTKVPQDEKICFISFDSSEWTVLQPFTHEIKRKYPDSKTAIIIYNSIQNNLTKVDDYSQNFDFRFTFDPYDAKKYGMNYFQGLMPLNISEKSDKKYDFCFIGNDKGRYDLIKSIYQLLSREGFKCFFHVTSKKTPKDVSDDCILSQNGLPFLETLRIEKASRCILDITNVSDERQGLSLRILEAIYCNCKVLSNNRYTQEVPEIKKGTLFFEDRPVTEELRAFLNDSSRIIDIKELDLGFEPIFAEIRQVF